MLAGHVQSLKIYDFWYESGQGTSFGQGTQTGFDSSCQCGSFYDPEYGQGSVPARFGCVHIEFFDPALLNHTEVKKENI